MKLHYLVILVCLLLPCAAATTTLWRDDFTTYSGYSTFEGWHIASGSGGAVTRSVVADAGADDGWALLVHMNVPAIVAPFTYKTITLAYAVSTITVRARFRTVWSGSRGHMAVVSIYEGTITESIDLADYGGTYFSDALFAWDHDGVSTTYKPIGSVTHTFPPPVSQITIVLENGDTRSGEASYGYWDWVEITTEEEPPNGPTVPLFPMMALPVAVGSVLTLCWRRR